MRGKMIVVSGVCILLSLVVCVHAKSLTRNLFVNEKGEKVYYSYYEDVEDEVVKKVESEGISAFENSNTPDNPKIGDIFKNGDEYERVIAVSEDGAFVSEVVTME